MISLGVLAVAACVQRTDLRAPLEVVAASSLTEAFTALAPLYERANPEHDLQLTFAGSQVHRLQIEHGSGASVFASADRAHVEALHAAGRIVQRTPFARNELVVITPRANPAGLRELTDLPRASRIVVGTESSPIGRYTQEMLQRAGPSFAAAVEARIASRESNVRLVRAKVILGEADAAIVYRTDAHGSEVSTVGVPDALQVPATYEIAVVEGAPETDAAERFVELVLSERGQQVLADHGFTAIRRTGP